MVDSGLHGQRGQEIGGEQHVTLSTTIWRRPSRSLTRQCSPRARQGHESGNGTCPIRACDVEGVPLGLSSGAGVHVIQELQWNPEVTDPDAIGVAVKDGAVTLTGAVSTYAQKFAAVRSASWVYG